MKMKRLLTMLFATILAVFASLFVVPQSEIKVKAAVNGKNLRLGASALSDNANTSSAAAVRYDSCSDTWQVIGYGGTGVASSSGTLTLIASGNMEQGAFDSSDSYNNNYSGSNLQLMIGTLAGRLSTEEAAAVATRTLVGGSANHGATGYDDDKISGSDVADAVMWPLSVAEANQLNADLRALDTANTYWASDYWWLRSPGGVDYAAAVVNGNGDVDKFGEPVNCSNEYGARPAFNLNLSSIIFTSAATGGKFSSGIGAAALTALFAYDGSSEWKLTVLDSTRSFSASRADTAAVPPEDTLVIDYRGATVGTNEFISAILLDSTGEILYYGRVQSKASGNTDGSALVTIPTGLADGNYTLKVFSEQYNGDLLTDLASAFSTISVTVDASAPRTYTLPVPPTAPEPSNVTPASQGSPEETMDDTPEANYFDELTTKLEEAIKAGGPQTIYWNEGTALPGPVMKLLQENPQITLVFSYTYEGLDYVVTIPGKYVKYDPNVPWCGPLYLYGLYGKYGTTTAPVATTTQAGERSYTVISGETLWGIAMRLGTSVEELVRLNNITDPDRISIGQIIRY